MAYVGAVDIDYNTLYAARRLGATGVRVVFAVTTPRAAVGAARSAVARLANRSALAAFSPFLAAAAARAGVAPSSVVVATSAGAAAEVVPAAPAASGSDSGSTLSGGSIAAIVICGAVGVALVAALVVWSMRKPAAKSPASNHA